MHSKTVKKVTYRIRIPVSSRRNLHVSRKRSKSLKGGFLPFLVPLIAATIGSIPGIASVALQAKQMNNS